jgi:hypothetical protein
MAKRLAPKQPQPGVDDGHDSRFSLSDSKTVVPLAATVISFCALAFTVYQGYLQREFLRLSIQPRMIVSFFYNEQGSGFMFGGAGIGYANLKVFEVFVDGKAQSSWLEMCHALGFAAGPRFEFVVPRPDTVFKPDSYDKVFWIASSPDSEELKLKHGRILIRACYCSVFDECWQVDTRDSHRRAVSACPTPSLTFTAPTGEMK